MPDRNALESQLAQWGAASAPAPQLPAAFQSRLRRRRVVRAMPAAFAGSAIACTLGVTLWIAARDGVSPRITPWSPAPLAHAAPDPEGLPLTPVRWAPAKSLRAGSCRDPQCVDSWLAGV